MKNNEAEEIILESDPRAASYKTNISGWVDRYGRYWGEDERQARYSGATHRKCTKCGEVYPKNGYCRACYRRQQEDDFAAMPKKVWDGKGMLYSMKTDSFYDSWEDVCEFADNDDISLEAMQLIICEPRYPRPLSYEDVCDLTDGMNLDDVDPELAALIDKVNEYILSRKRVHSWIPGRFRADIQAFEDDHD